MKVNIAGRGVIPGLNKLAPVRGVELSQRDIERLVCFRQFKVYSAETGYLITSKNVNDIFKPKAVAPKVVKPVEKPVEIKPVEKPIEINITEPEIKEEPIVETKPVFLNIKEIRSESVETEITEDGEIFEEISPVETATVSDESDTTEETTTTDTTEQKEFRPRKKNKYKKH